MIPRFKKSRIEPKPIETDYWVDINENEFGGVFKYYDYNNEVWKQIQTITSEKEPKFTNSPAYKITDRDIVDWNSKASYADFDEFKEEVVYAINKIGTIDTSYIESDIQNLKNQLDTKADKNAVPTNQELRRVEDKIPTKVSQLENDSKYITVDEVPELPDSIVSDSNYVHTDNNFTDELKDKLTNLDPDASNYDDTEVRNLIKDNTRLIESNTISIRNNAKNITSNANSIADINSNLNTKANLDDVYTREYLDSLFNTFVRKTHKTYGFCDDRPTDLENEDTGFVFYDYTVNEPIIWVSSEWRILVGNIPLTTVVKDEDILETIGDWEYVKLNDDFCKLTAFIGDKTNEELDLKVPNLYNTYFALEVGEKDYDDYLVEDKLVTGLSLGWNDKTSSWGELIPRYEYTIIYDPEDYFTVKSIKSSFEDLLETGQSEITNIFQKPVFSINYDGVEAKGEFATDKTLVNSITFGQGIKNINTLQFANFELNPNNSVLKLPSGCNKIGSYCFYNSNFKQIEFPVNPMKIGVNAFRQCNIDSVTLPKTLTYEECANGNGTGMFRNNNNSNGITLNLQEGTQAIPNYCFTQSIINNKLVLPKSLKYIGAYAFASAEPEIETLDTRNIEYLGSYAFYYNSNSQKSFVNVKISGNTKAVLPRAIFANFSTNEGTGYNTNRLKTYSIEEGVRKIYPNGVYINAGLCNGDFHVPGSLEQMPTGCISRWGNQANMVNNLDVPFNFTIGEGVKSIGYLVMLNIITSTEFNLPDSIEQIYGYAFQHCSKFSNKTFRIPKNLRWVGMYGTTSELINNKEAYELYLKKDNVYISKSGYFWSEQPYEFLKDGGFIDDYGSNPFYNTFTDNLEAFTCDEDHQYFKVVDGVFFSKDGRKLIAYPPARIAENNTYEIPEGVEFIYVNAFSRTQSPDQYEFTYSVTNPFTNETLAGTASNADFNYMKKHGNTGYIPEGRGLKNLVLPNSYVIKDRFEHNHERPQYKFIQGSNLHNSLYFGGVENYLVKEDNPRYKSIDGIIYSKDGTTLIAMPRLKHGNIVIPEGVTTIKDDFLTEISISLPGDSYRHPTDEEGAQYFLEHGNFSMSTNNGNKVSFLYLELPSTLVNISDFELAIMNAIFKVNSNKIFVDPANPAFTTNETYTQLIRK